MALNANRHTSLLVDMAEGLRACMRDPQLRAVAVAKVRANAERSPNFPTWKAVFEEDARVFLESEERRSALLCHLAVRHYPFTATAAPCRRWIAWR